jgi:hypothetical protein
VELSGARWPGIGGSASELRWLEVGDEADSRGPIVKETRGRRPAREGVNRRGKRISREDATDTRAGWAGRAISACGDGVAGGLAVPEAKRAAGSAGPKIKKKKFLN